MKVIAIILGGVLLIVAARGTEVDSTSGNGDGLGFWPVTLGVFEQKEVWAWAAAVTIVGLFGFIKPVQPFADGILALMVIALLIGKKTFFEDLQRIAGSPV
jgi:hypothetical protein